MKKMIDVKTNPVAQTVGAITTMNIGARSTRDIDLDLNKLTVDIKAQFDKVRGGNLDEVGAILFAQATILQDYFLRMISYASVAEESNDRQVFSQLALKAQNQCRTTLATLVDIKHPKNAMFIKQQNNALNQQVNNYDAAKDFSKKSERENELLKGVGHASLDEGRAQTTIRANPAMEAMEAVDRGKDS